MRTLLLAALLTSDTLYAATPWQEDAAKQIPAFAEQLLGTVRQAIADGAQEIDMVINIGRLKGGDHDAVFDDIRAVVEASQGRPVKVILETSMLERAEKIAGSAISKAAGAAFVKTSTGFGGGGAQLGEGDGGFRPNC